MSPAKEQFIPIRPGIVDYLTRGDISLFEFAVYFLIHAQADFSKGVWHGSAPRIIGTAPRGSELRKVQRAIERLADLGLLRTFNTQGQRGNYPVLINKYTIRSGPLKGMRVNAAKSAFWTTPYCEPCADAVADNAPSQEVRDKKKQERENPAAKTAPPVDPRYQPFYVAAFEAFKGKNSTPPVWGGKDKNSLRQFLKEHPGIPLTEWEIRVRNYFTSTERFTVKQGGSLAYFISKFDAFASGPILERTSTGRTHAKPDINQAARTTLESHCGQAQPN